MMRLYAYADEVTRLLKVVEDLMVEVKALKEKVSIRERDLASLTRMMCEDRKRITALESGDSTNSGGGE